MTVAKPAASSVIELTGSERTEAFVQSVIDDAAILAQDCIKGYDADRQEAIVKWLAAHLLASTQDDAVLTSEKLGDAQQSYARAAMGAALAGTTYGQQALALDPKGCLARLGRSRASVQVV